MHLPRIELTAPSSGSGKTMITCGLLQVLKNRGRRVVSYKCGPDYIDPMFHRTVLGTPSHNLDTFFTDEETTRYLMTDAAERTGADIGVVEGVMGYYDGLGAVSEKASAYDIARVTETPVILIVNCKGASLSILPMIKGFMTYRKDSRIRGVILNRMSSMLYPRIKMQIEAELGISVLGYVPQTDILSMDSRHLGLVMPEEIEDIREKLQELAALLEKTLDIEGILQLAESAPPIQGRVPDVPHVDGQPVIAVARDRAFCFYYEENLQLLRRAGAKLVEFSPLEDETLPCCDGILLGGGYPELYLPQLSANRSMRSRIKAAVLEGKPVMAECGGFMYLLEEMEDMDGQSWPVVGALSGRSFRTQKLQRFGYISLSTEKKTMLSDMAQDTAGETALAEAGQIDTGQIRGHEFHYFDSTNNGDDYLAAKPQSDRHWRCIQAHETLIAGYPHLYYYAHPVMAARFVSACAAYRVRQRHA